MRLYASATISQTLERLLADPVVAAAVVADRTLPAPAEAAEPADATDTTDDCRAAPTRSASSARRAT